MKNTQEEELDAIREETTLTAGQHRRKPGETVKLRSKSTKTVHELELVIESLRRVIDKQKVELEALRKASERFEATKERGANEPALKQKII